jgi:uncharacterized protein DUF4340
MKPKTLAILAALAAITVVVAAFVSRKDRPVTPPAPTEAKRLYEELPAKLDSVAAVSVKHGDKEFTLRKAAAGWEVAEKGGYPAKPDAVRKTLVGLAELRTSAQRTSRPDLYSKINVQDPDGKPLEPGAAGPTLLTLKDDKGGVVAAAIIGTVEPSMKPAVNIRKVGETQSWLAQGSLEAPTEITQWIDTEIVKIPKERIKSVTITQPDGATVVMSRAKPEDQNFAIADVPAGKELKSANAGDAVAQSLAYFTMDDVSPADQIDFDGKSGGKPGAYSEFRTFDGLVLAVQLVDAGGKKWAKILANYEEQPAAPVPTEAKPGEQTPEQVAREAAKKEMNDLNARLGRWAYALPDYKVTTLSTKMEDLLKSDAPPPPPPSMEGTTPLTPPPPTPSGG